MAEPQGKQPDVLTPTADLSREEWLSFRRQGIGGSDAAAVLGISPFRTGVDLYYDKLGQPVEDDEQNWVAKEVGTLLEDLVARIFAKKTGLKVWPMPAMYRHPDHPCMLADIDRLVMLPKGETAILECKTTNANATSKWEYDGKPSWAVNTCDTEYQEECAKLLINSEWGFEASRIQLQGTPYYDATDWNFIRFRCGPLDWLMKDGELYQIYQ